MSKQRIQQWMRPVATGLTAGVLVTGCVNADNGASATAVVVPAAVATAPAVRTAPAAAVTAVAGAQAAAAVPTASPHDKPGFFTQLDTRDGRLWVFEADSEDLAKFKADGRPARHVLRPGAGPDGLTLKSTESSTIIEYVATKPGFVVSFDPRDERLWVFEAGSEDLAKFKADGRPARHVLRPGAGPLGLTLKSTESSTIIEYVATKPGFVVSFDPRDERLWVFEAGSEDLAKFKAEGRPARHALRPGAGPLGLTLKSTELDTIVAYVVAQPGFFTEIDERDGRLWVFKAGSEDFEAYKAKGRPARHVLRPSAGPMGLTIKSTEAEVLDAYQARF